MRLKRKLPLVHISGSRNKRLVKMVRYFLLPRPLLIMST